MFVDASALCVVLLNEPERDQFYARMMDLAVDKTTSSIAVWETMRAIVRETNCDGPAAFRIIERFLEVAQIDLMMVGPVELPLAIEAFDRFGKTRHPAALNMGDCFAYACARSYEVPLLFKGNDFPQTDIEPALTR